MGTRKFLENKAHAVGASSTPMIETPQASKTLAFSSTVASAGTVVTLMVPSSGRRFRLIGGWVTPSAADTVFLRGVASTLFQINARAIQNGTAHLSIPQGGVAAPSANSALLLDAGAGGTIVTGTIFYSEER